MTSQSGGPKDSPKDHQDTSNHVIDFTTVRQKKLEDKRKNAERIFFRDLLSVYSVSGRSSHSSGSKMHPVELLDVSEDGCAIQTVYDPENPWPRESTGLPLRLYFSQEMYLEVFISIKNSTPSIENNRRCLRLGCTIDQSSQSYPAYQQFVRFLKLYAEQAHKDNGNLTQFYL
jgi:hypothetical protein